MVLRGYGTGRSFFFFASYLAKFSLWLCVCWRLCFSRLLASVCQISTLLSSKVLYIAQEESDFGEGKRLLTEPDG